MSKYLIIEPALTNVSIISEIILKNDLNAEILRSNSENDIISFIQSENPDIIFINSNFPDQQGLILCKNLKSNSLITPIPVVLFSNISVQEIFSEDVINSGADGFLPNLTDELNFRLLIRSLLRLSQSKIKDQEKLSKEIATGNDLIYKGIFDTVKDSILIYRIDPDQSVSNFIEANAAATEMLGFSKEELIEKNILDIEHESSSQLIIQRITDCAENKQGNFETVIYHKDGHPIRVNVLISIIPHEKQFTVINIIHDLTERMKVIADLLESEKTYQNLIERFPDGVYKSTHEGNFVEVNNAMVKMLGYSSKQELLGIDIKSELYFEPEDRESLTLQEKYEEMGVFMLRKKDGSGIWVEDHGWYTLNNEGEIIFHEGIMRDVTDRKSGEEALMESEERFKMLFEKAPIGYQSLDEKGYFIGLNETWEELMGYQKNEVIGTWFGNYLTPNSCSLFEKRFSKFKSSGKVHTEFEMIKKDGSIIIIQLEGRIGHSANGQFKQTHCVLSDITERRKIEKAIADERILLRTLIDNIPDVIFVKDKLGRRLISNKADLELFGLSSEKEVIGKTDLELLDFETGSQTHWDDLSVIKGSQAIINKISIHTNSNGHKKYLSITKVPLMNDSGETIGLIGVGHDLTKEKLTDQKIIQLSKGIEQSPASIILTDSNGNIEYVNQKLHEVTGFSLEEVKGKNPRIFQSGYTTKEEYAKLWETISSGNEYRGEIQNRKKNGDIIWESVLISPIRDESNKIVNYIAIKEDITERKKSNLELLKLSVAIDQNPASVVITDTRGNIEYINRKFANVSGYSQEELIGRTLRILKPGHNSDETYIEIWNNLFAGKEWRGEHQNRNKKNVKYWESVLISPIKNQENKVTNYIIISEDISDRKRMEEDLIKAKEKAEESDKLKSAFLANMSHEIRTPLNSILGFSDLLSDPSLKDESRLEFSELINASGNNLLAIINDVLDISKIEAGQIVIVKKEFSVQQMISEIQKEYSIKAKSKGIDLRIASDSQKEGIIVFSDEMRIKQIIINFVGNALKFTDSGYIEIGVKQIDSNLQFHVKDTGIGIAKEFHDKIFERFRQVESAQTRRYGGNGLGLAITKNLAQLLGGNIWIESEPEKGSTFYFTLINYREEK